MKQGTILGSQIGRWIILAALVALLGALLLTIRPVGAQDAPPTIPNPVTVFDYNENGTGQVTKYTATDPERDPVFWTLGGPDAADFTIEDGSLRFKSPPNFEVPTDRPNDEDGRGGIAPPTNLGEDPPVPGEGAANNVYKVTVRFSAGGEDDAPVTVTTEHYDGDDLGEVDLTVNVINVDEPGGVGISPMQPQVGTAVTAILTDDDTLSPGVGEWQWARSDSMSGPFTDITDDSTDMTYRPTDADLDKYLRVTVVYVDRAGPAPREVMGVSPYPVRKDIVSSNRIPKFPDQSTLIGLSTGSTEERDTTDRFISEIAAAGDNVGAPVTAFDDNTEIEVLTYSLRDSGAAAGADDDSNIFTPAHRDGHAASFNINETTGQITVSDRARLNADVTTPTPTNPYIVVVRAVDGDGKIENITVTIHVLEKGEPPRIDRVYRAEVEHADYANYLTGDRAPTEMSHYEEDRTVRSAIRIDTELDSSVLYSTEGVALADGAQENTVNVQPATYTAMDPEDSTGASIRWSVGGPDADKFWFEDTDLSTPLVRENAGPVATLEFKRTAFESLLGPDFENPEDANTDNVYEVTIVVTDGTVDIEGNVHRDELQVTVKVIDSTDDNRPGTVTLSNRQPEVGRVLTATFEDPDGPTRALKWQWYRSIQEGTQRDRCSGYDPHDPPAGARGPNGAVRYFIRITLRVRATLLGNRSMGQIRAVGQRPPTRRATMRTRAESLSLLHRIKMLRVCGVVETLVSP